MTIFYFLIYLLDTNKVHCLKTNFKKHVLFKLSSIDYCGHMAGAQSFFFSCVCMTATMCRSGIMKGAGGRCAVSLSHVLWQRYLMLQLLLNY